VTSHAVSAIYHRGTVWQWDLQIPVSTIHVLPYTVALRRNRWV